MSKVVIESRITHRYLMGKSKEELAGMVLDLIDQNSRHILLAIDLYYTAHREGWEPGESTDEVCDRAHSYLCNLGLDPYTNDGPEAIERLRMEVER